MTDLIDTTEMYLRTIYELVEEGIVPLRARIAERLIAPRGPQAYPPTPADMPGTMRLADAADASTTGADIEELAGKSSSNVKTE